MAGWAYRVWASGTMRALSLSRWVVSMALLRITMPSLCRAVIAACRLWDVNVLVLCSSGVRWMVVMSSWTVDVAIF